MIDNRLRYGVYEPARKEDRIFAYTVFPRGGVLVAFWFDIGHLIRAVQTWRVALVLRLLAKRDTNIHRISSSDSTNA